MDCINESWLQVMSLFLANAALILWFRAESRSDWRHLDTKIEASQRETNAKIDSNQKETNLILKAIQDEIKDFHGRLCAIEERNKNAK